MRQPPSGEGVAEASVPFGPLIRGSTDASSPPEWGQCDWCLLRGLLGVGLRPGHEELVGAWPVISTAACQGWKFTSVPVVILSLPFCRRETRFSARISHELFAGPFSAMSRPLVQSWGSQHYLVAFNSIAPHCFVFSVYSSLCLTSTYGEFCAFIVM